MDKEADAFISSFNTRIRLGLQRRGIYTIEQLLEKTPIDLLHFPNLGLVSVNNIVLELEKIGMKLKEIPNQHSAVYIPKKLDLDYYRSKQKALEVPEREAILKRTLKFLKNIKVNQRA